MGKSQSEELFKHSEETEISTSLRKPFKVDQIEDFVKNISSLCMNHQNSDVEFIVDNERIPAHRVILAAWSEYFRALLFNGMLETNKREIELPDTPAEAFRQILRYIYSGKLTICETREDLLPEILILSHRYGFMELEQVISDHMVSILDKNNVCTFLEIIAIYGQPDIIGKCQTFFDRHASEIIESENFTSLSFSSLILILSRDSLIADEVKIFMAVTKWLNINKQISDKQKNDLLNCVRFSLISIQNLLEIVRPTGLVSADKLLDYIAEHFKPQNTRNKPQFRFLRLPEENMAKQAFVKFGENKFALFEGVAAECDFDRYYTRHNIDSANDSIVIELKVQCIINYIRMQLWDNDLRAYSYKIETSVDGTHWRLIIDYSHYHCRSWQNLVFEPEVLKFIRITGTDSTENRDFHLVHFECMYTEKMIDFDPETNIIIPKDNVATFTKHATVIEGVCRSRNSLIDGDTQNYNVDLGYTCHQIGEGSIAIQLPQPYLISSMRLLLWDLDSRNYSFFIEVSNDKKNWEPIMEERRHVRSWQLIEFQPKPVVYIRITGTHNSANAVFHCVHFECPAQKSII